MLAEQHLRAGRFAKAGYQWWKLTQRGGAREQAYAGLIVAAVSADRLRLADRLIARYEATCDLSQRRRHLSHMWQLAMPGRLLTDLRNGTLSEDRSQLLPGLLADAADVLAKHLVDHVDHADKHFHLAMCRSAMGRNDLAAAGLDRALRLNSGYIAAARHRTELLLDESNLAAAAAVVASTIAARPDAELSMLDLSLCITVMRGNVATAAEELSRIDESHRHAIGASAVRLLERYASPRACRQWLTASSATMQTDALALGEAA
jgi:tetratricopeptide (TPR) repeat protein